jgi:hypothetical protein
MASIKDIMDGLVDPLSDVVFKAVATIAVPQGPSMSHARAAMSISGTPTSANN